MTTPTVHIAVPVLAEEANISRLVRLYDQSEYPARHLWICVNQPDSWCQAGEEEREVVAQNHRTLQFFQTLGRNDITVIDRSSPGKGWPPKRQGVGMARKTLMDAIARQASSEEVILSMDADTFWDPDYLTRVVQRLEAFPQALALAVPYYHPLPQEAIAARAMLRYELYMRYYALNMYARELPYARTALGSAIALRVAAYTRIGGMTPKAGGEDFYLLQKLAKAGLVLDHCEAVVRPSPRFSDRVPIGTGPALRKGASGNWSGYPFYPASLFDEVKATFDAFPLLFHRHVETPMSPFLRAIFKEQDPWERLRNNFKTESLFVRACWEKVDGLRIRQYLRFRYLEQPADELTVLNDFLREKYATFVPFTGFDEMPIARLNALREALFQEELQARRCHDENRG